MDLVARNRLGITRLLAAAERRLPREALGFLEGVLAEPALLQSLRFCAGGEWPELASLIQIDANSATWQIRLEGHSAPPEGLLTALRRAPIWFLAVQGAPLEPLEPDPLMAERGARLIDSLQAERARRVALLDQIDAALDAGDRASYERLCRLLQELSPLS